MIAHWSRRAALRLEAAEDVDRLRRQPDMRHHRNAALAEEADGLAHALAAFELDGAALGFLHHHRRIAERLLRAFLIGAERHVDDDQRPLGAAHHRAAMQDHQVERHGKRRLESMHHHAERVAHQQEVDILVGNRRRMGVIGGERDDGVLALAGGDLGRREALGGDML